MYKHRYENITPSSWTRLVFRLALELLILLVLLGIFRVMFIIEYRPIQERLEVQRVHQQLIRLVQALQAYTQENPQHRHFPPGPYLSHPGKVLTPLQEPHPARLFFLTTPTAYLERIPLDPYLTRISGETFPHTPLVLHWVRPHYVWEDLPGDYDPVGWGAFSIGPSLQLPPQYDMTVLRRIPYENVFLPPLLYDPSNGLNSIGLLYYDTFGNSNHFDFSPLR